MPQPFESNCQPTEPLTMLSSISAWIALTWKLPGEMQCSVKTLMLPCTTIDLFCNSKGTAAPAMLWTSICWPPSMPQPFSSIFPKLNIGWDTLSEIATVSRSKMTRPVMSLKAISMSFVASIGISTPCASTRRPTEATAGVPFSNRLDGKIEASAPLSNKISCSSSKRSLAMLSCEIVRTAPLKKLSSQASFKESPM